MKRISLLPAKERLLICLAACTVAAVVLAGCVGGDPQETETFEPVPDVSLELEATDDATGDASTEAAQDSAAQTADSSNRESYGGISFELQEGWTTAPFDDQTLDVVIPDDGSHVAQIEISHFTNNMTGTEESLRVESFMEGVLEAFEVQENYESSIKDGEIGGHAAQLAECTFTLNGSQFEAYVLVVGVEDGITSIMAASTDGAYNNQFKDFIDSVKVEG